MSVSHAFSHLTASQRDSLRTRMKERIELLRREVLEGLHDAEATGAALERDARELNELTTALARLDSPDFGICIECGGPISWPRLNVEPEAARCIICQTRFERERPQRIAGL